MNTKNMFLCCVIVCALLLPVISPDASAVRVSFGYSTVFTSPGKPIPVVATVVNDGPSNDTFNLGVSGDCAFWTVLSDTVISIPAGATKHPTLTVTPSSLTSALECDLGLYAISTSDSTIWGSGGTSVHIQNSAQFTGKTHLQTDPVDNESNTPLVIGPAGLSAQSGGHGMGFDFILNPKLETRGYVMSANDKACVGDTMSMSDSSTYGEWYAKGGPNDSPPIEFVSDLESVKAQINQGTYQTKVYRASVCPWRQNEEKVEGPKKCIVDAVVICSSGCILSPSGPVETLASSQFKITGEGQINIKADCPTDCIFFVDRKDVTYYPPYSNLEPQTLPDAYGMMYVKSPGLISSNIVLNSIASSRGPDLELKSVTYPSSTLENQPVYVKLSMENSGDMEAKIASVTLNLPNSEILDAPSTIGAGTTQDIIVKADAKDVPQLKAEIAYKSDTIGCLNTKDFKETFTLGTLNILTSKTCSDTAECEGIGLTTPFCCRGICRDAAVGTCDDRNSDGKFEWSYY